VAIAGLCCVLAANMVGGQSGGGPGQPPGDSGRPADVEAVAQQTGQDDQSPGGGGPALRIVPPGGRVPIGMDRQFRLAGPDQDLTWVLVETSAPDVASLSEDGRLSALLGGWAVIGVADSTATVVATTDTVWLAGGPTAISARGGRAIAALDTFLSATFPANASPRALMAHIERITTADLPANARGKGRPISVCRFDVADAVSGEDVGGTEGFDEEVLLTVTYDEEALPEDVAEEDLLVASFDEEEEEWEEVPPEQDYEAATENNTITVGTTHASYWSVMPAGSTDYSTAAQEASWGQLKQTNRR